MLRTPKFALGPLLTANLIFPLVYIPVIFTLELFSLCVCVIFFSVSLLVFFCFAGAATAR